MVPSLRRSRGALVMLALAGLVPMRSSAQTASVAAPVATSTGTPLKINTVLRTAEQRTTQDTKVALLAILLDAVGGPLSGKSVTFKVKTAPANTLVTTLTGTTDAKGRALAYFTTPAQSVGSQWNVVAEYAGDSTYASSSDTRLLQVEAPAHTGRVQVPEGATVSVSQTDGTQGRLFQLRALVSGFSGSPGGFVRFWLNGVNIGSAAVGSSGLARMGFTPSSAHVSNLTKAGAHNWAGPVEAWYEPPTGSSLRAAAGIGPAFIWENTPSCDFLGTAAGSKCSAAWATPTTSTSLVTGVLTVNQGSFGQAQVTTPPKMKVVFAVPPKPPANSDCVASAIPNGADFCKRDCERLEYLTISHLGTLQALLGSTAANQAKSCVWPFEKEITLNDTDYRNAHDRCRDVAAQQNKQTWNHDVTLSVKHRVAAVFKFRDPHTESIPGGWHASLTYQPIIRDGEVTVPLSVKCR